MSGKVNELWLLGGVTGVGKTELSLEWAEKNNAEILSCDSVAFYRGLDIGSAKPCKEDLDRVVHHGIDLAELSEVFNVTHFHEYAHRVLVETYAKGKKILVVGGSGFFLNGFLNPITDGIRISEKVRKKAQAIYEMGGLRSLIDELGKMNPNGLGSLDQNNPARVLRAVERCMESGLSLIDLHKNFTKLSRPYAGFKKRMLWLDRANEDLMERIHLRTQFMIDKGMIEETEEAIRKGIENHPSLSSAVGYREVIHFLRHGGEKEGLAESIAQSTRQLVAKQRKWFRKHFPNNACLHMEQGGEVDVNNFPWVSGT